ncbi:hypothetical protein Dimus_016115, partial [Dionaea muscipula]
IPGLNPLKPEFFHHQHAAHRLRPRREPLGSFYNSPDSSADSGQLHQPVDHHRADPGTGQTPRHLLRADQGSPSPS